MKKTLEIDATLLAEAKAAIGATTDTATIRAGLDALVRQAAYQRLAALGGSEPDAQDVPRRREVPRRSRPSRTKTRRSAA
jgi:Arc/MetJ family transcription regulator